MNVSTIFVLSLLLVALHPGVQANILLSPSSARTLEDRKACENSLSFGFEGNSSRTCDAYVALKPVKRCRKIQPGTEKKLRFFCPSTCKRKCQDTPSPTSSPTVFVPRKACENSLSFGFDGNSSRTCDAYVALKPVKRCRKIQPGTEKKLRFFCPSTCKGKCQDTRSPTSSPTVTRGECDNSVSFGFDGNSSRTCDAYVALKPVKRCRKIQPGTEKKLRFFCPSTCKKKCDSFFVLTNSPTRAPTRSPTSPPTATASSSPSSSPSTPPSTPPSASPTTSLYPSSAPSDGPTESEFPTVP